MIDFRGARGSNAGDDFHELWATRQAIRLLLNEEGLEAIAVEGLGSRDEAGKPPDTWDGVDCTLYFGGRDAKEADRIQIEQLKYSAANPNQSWTVARLIKGKRRDRSVIGRLAKAWRELAAFRSPAPPPRVVLVSNQPVDPVVLSAVRQAAGSPLIIPTRSTVATAAPELRLACASELDVDDFQAFASVLDFETGTGSRFALEEQVLQTMAEWTDLEVQGIVTRLREFVRKRMMPESAGELITRESVLLHFGASDEGTLFPCPSEIRSTETPVSRASVQEAATLLRSGVQYLCLHGGAGVGKTTALQELDAALPADSIMVKYDCYGGGRYLDPSALRHRTQDAFLQLTNELAARLKLPLLLSRRQDSDYPRLFVKRLKYAADVLKARNSSALIVIAVDAADNAIYAAQSRNPAESAFVHDFVHLTDQPENIRFIVTARTGRLEFLRLPRSYRRKKIRPFNRTETGENVARIWPDASKSWIDDFHHLSHGIPRIQAYAFEVNGAHPSTALDRLMPGGKSLEEIFRGQFEDASRKSGNSAEVELLCAGLIALPRPVPLSDLAAVLNSTEELLSDVCVDLSPGIRLQNGTVSFADEDFEVFVRTEGEGRLSDVHRTAATWLLSRADNDHYAALNVAEALVAAGRGHELLDLVENEPVPHAVKDPVLRREAELRRLRLALKVCREAGDIVRALRFVLIGAEGIKTEDALRRLLAENPDLTARFAYETAGRLILSDADHMKIHGPLLFQKLAVDANRNDAISVREGWRFLQAWLGERSHDQRDNEDHYHEPWKISISDISSTVEAAFKLDGPPASLSALQRWTPKRVALEVALVLPYQLIAEGYGDAVETLATEDHLDPLPSLFLLVPLALAGRPVDSDRMVCGLEQLVRCKLHVKKFFKDYSHGQTLHGKIIDVALTVCEICTIKKTGDKVIDELLTNLLDSELRRIDRRSAHETFKLDVLLRAYALRETRENRIPTVKSVFEPRPQSDREGRKHQERGEEERHDQELNELADTVFDLYATTANALVNQLTDSKLEDELRQARSSFGQKEWRISRQFNGGALRDCAARNLTTLLAAGYRPEVIISSAFDIHDRQRAGYEIPNRSMVARLSLWPQLHHSLVEILSSSSEEARNMRIGASDKSRILVGYARYMRPLSERDANEIFNYAIEAASELDHEIMTQIELSDQLVIHSNQCFTDARNTAQSFSNIVADAAIRLDDNRHFPWDRAMSALARLDTPLALANVARWDDEGIAILRETLPTVLMTSLSERTIRLEQAAALAMLSDDAGEVMVEILKRWDHTEHRNCLALIEEAAYNSLIQSHNLPREIIERTAQIQPHGSWMDSLLRQRRFLATLPAETITDRRMERHTEEEVECSINMHVWNRETLIESSMLQRVAQELSQTHARDGRTYLSFHTVFESARRAVSPSDRILHLEALAGVEGFLATRGAVDALFDAVDRWWMSPSIKAWCREDLPDIIVARFPEVARYLVLREEDRFTLALNRTGLSGVELQKLILSGLERHVDGLHSELVFKLAGMIGCMLDPSDAAGLVDWYVKRLEERMPAENRDQTAPPCAIPREIDETVARFLFAYMGDCDLRLRWRSAHAVRRLARTGDEATLKALIGEYDRCEEEAFRGRNFAFYWLAARLWFALTWDRIAVEAPEQAKNAACILRRIVLDDSFPHILVRSFARDACEKLIKAGQLSLTDAENDLLKSVNETTLPRKPEARRAGPFSRGPSARWDKDRRFDFDFLDTIPYWYEPMLRSFTDVDIEHFLREVERWIIDVWGYNDASLDWNRERHRGCFRYDNGSLSRNGHGSRPTLEHLRTHLEWHAMWCAAGGLLKTEPLTPCDKSGWDELSDRIRWEKLVEPPLWSADLRTPTPLAARNWRPDAQAFDDWVSKIDEAIYRTEILSDDSPEYMVVDGSSMRRASDRSEGVSICSALVEPTTGRSLLRALQMMDDTWDYKVPDEGEERAEIDEGPYRFLGWLVHPSRDSGIDDKDPLRAYGLVIHCRPGRWVRDACNLRRNVAGRPCWSSSHAERPMFVYETWGEPEKGDERYTTHFTVSGHRLLAHKGQLLNFLHDQDLDLIIEVEVGRHGGKNRRYAGEEGHASQEGKFARLYRFDNRGGLEVAEGRLGTWTDDSSTA